MYIDRIYIDEEYREAGIVSFLIESLNDILLYTNKFNPSVYILLPNPHEKDKNGNICNIEDERQKEICMKKLLKLYKKLGLKNTRNTKFR